MISKGKNNLETTILSVPQTPEAFERVDPLSLNHDEELHDLVEYPQNISFDLIWSYNRVISKCLLVAFAGFIFGYDTGTIGGILELTSAKAVLGELGIDGYQIPSVIHGLIISMYHIGCIAGGFTIVRLADYMGRRRPIQIAMCCYITGITIQITTVFTHKWWQFMIGRMVTGLCIGSAGVLGPMLISETAPSVIRGSLTSMYGLMITVGILIGSIAIFITKQTINGNEAWIVPLFIGMGIAFIVACGIFFTPESPRYLISIGKVEEARCSLASVDEKDIENTIETIKSKLDLEKNAIQVGFVEMVSNKHNFKRLVIGMSLMLFQQMSGIDYFFYFGTTLFKSVGISDSYATLIILAAVNHCMSWVGLYVVERFGRKPSLLIGAFVEFICMIIYSTVGSTMIKLDGTSEENKVPGTIMIVFTCVFVMVFAITWATSVAVVCSEVFPLQIRSKAFGLSIAFNWGANFFIAFCTPVITEHIHYMYGYVFAGCIFASFWFVLLIVPETRGISLEQMGTLFEDEKENIEL
jgi:SP family sugar:H+ symporter-like MFS transporter